MSVGLAVSVLVLGLVGVAATWAASRLNRGGLSLQKKARAFIRERLAQLPPQHSLESFVLNCVPLEHWAKARFLLEEISKSLNVPIDSLTFDTKLRDVLRVSVSELGDIERRNEQPHPQYVEPFTYDLLHVLERVSDKKSWEERWNAKPELPRNEEALADFVMEMTPAEFLSFFAPLVRVK